MAADDPVAASHFVRELTRKMEWVALSSFPGVPRDELSQGLKALPYRNRCIYFRTTETTVRILRVLHGHQNVSADYFKTEEI
ncbi:type II toxin-antitoxin system RelE/ParE family toxin [Rhizobium populisoli]|uniref:type II toxin-antitoxin system RelE/ParE family toxin n=1 Tax=Rhizobium populisoli TaxID=2859785 RepID=UPI0028ADD840|nr:type II toxin-antitoxin system RelE/ParE family toxin [Rhizobium populisoli]